MAASIRSQAIFTCFHICRLGDIVDANGSLLPESGFEGVGVAPQSLDIQSLISGEFDSLLLPEWAESLGISIAIHLFDGGILLPELPRDPGRPLFNWKTELRLLCLDAVDSESGQLYLLYGRGALLSSVLIGWPLLGALSALV